MESGRAAIRRPITISVDTHQGREGSDAKKRIGPAHQWTVGNKAGDSLSLIRCEFHAANPQENQDEAISNGIPPHGFQRLRRGGGHWVVDLVVAGREMLG